MWPVNGKEAIMNPGFSYMISKRSICGTILLQSQKWLLLSTKNGFVSNKTSNNLLIMLLTIYQSDFHIGAMALCFKNLRCTNKCNSVNKNWQWIGLKCGGEQSCSHLDFSRIEKDILLSLSVKSTLSFWSSQKFIALLMMLKKTILKIYLRDKKLFMIWLWWVVIMINDGLITQWIAYFSTV